MDGWLQLEANRITERLIFRNNLFLINNEEHNGRRCRFDWESGQRNMIIQQNQLLWLKNGGKGRGGPRSGGNLSHVRLYFLVRIRTLAPPRRSCSNAAVSLKGFHFVISSATTAQRRSGEP